MLSIVRALVVAVAAGALTAAAVPASAQTFPSRPVTFVVPFAPGGSTDTVARIVAQAAGGPLGVPTVVENRTGGAGVVGWSAVARAAPDGHTLLTLEMSFTIAAGLIPTLPFDPRKGFVQVTTAVENPHVMVVNPDLPAKTVAELIALLKANPGKYFFGSGGNGTNTHMGGELFKSLAGVDLVHVPYRGAGAVLQDLVAGQVQVLVTSLPTALPLIQSGKLRPLMVAAAKRSPVLPEVPTAAEAGLPGMVMNFWVGFAVPAGTPAPVVARLNTDILAGLAQPDTRKRLAELGMEPVGNTPAEAEALIESEIARWSAIAKAANIKMQ
ncbi:tripartite tricarboxylate transporter substrate binding protein [Rhodoplanes sp. TEM]|uniref:Tripartite tricarboxylate transporter substrate binding protein n=1 Tax=Rhodoplanes tepidamans TaxID=200616 RepID=A0ABT5JII7_RHOTP|nr:MULTISPECIES: tripartite tricarboxylate transporter substrate binding protein [Rhodoplanes]MDC7789505.1 tripartite tricarboxylate transporter substrate binding protein [Rhodoplanes tepidamans]MDC7987484.1 tripartite tricarboxylate transporter substrate binding protein [Rhodoplanes sp. TEM]MDQ0359119.1 tripartite-type tricarboxylate transporter receptor subunit TctC [Rhodoplanes tepidamans]